MPRSPPDARDAMVRDLDSRNGILVNGAKTKEARLRHGDVVQIGHLQVKFVDEVGPVHRCAAAAARRPHAATRILDAPTVVASRRGDEEALAMTTQASMPDKIGRYQILERVGKGGMGVLYRGHDPVLDREVAVKVMLADFSDDTEQMRPRFYREAKSAAKLQHRNIVTVFEFAEENNQPHIVMEFLRGSPLSSRMEEQPPLTLDDKLDIVTQLCSGLGYAHKEGIVHRDVKPANVFILQDGTVKLLDFGIAKLATSTLTRQGDVVGSAPYMSPEQIAGAQDLDGRSDVWSTGVLLYELLTGRKPFDGEGLTTVIAGILREQPPPIEQLRARACRQQLLDCVAKALEKDRDRRYQTAEELGRELQLIRKTHQLNAPPPMDETRFASTNVLKALHDDRQKQDQGALGNKTLQQPPPPRSRSRRRSRIEDLDDRRRHSRWR